MRPRATASVVAAAGAAGALAYAAGYEVRAYALRRVTVPVLAAGQRPLRVLHVSDLHLVPGQRRKREWLRSLDALEPDLVVDTGDNLASPDAVPAVLDAFGPLLERPGVFVFGSNDYYAPKPKNPARYLLPSGRQRRVHGPPLPWPDLRDAFTASGWADLDNATTTLELDGRYVDFRGLDDPHINRDDYDAVVGTKDVSADLTVGVVHAPYRRALDAFAADRMDVILAGHTHGGQLCLPWFGALVTNCDLPRSRAKGLSRWRESWLHVSAGLGTSPYAPVRFACRPEATLLTLVPA
ncbi:MAG: metallophosphoesterase [Actinomycetota bacterium]|nr:metallophosphoesterase [Actinomycetota bacterium]